MLVPENNRVLDEGYDFGLSDLAFWFWFYYSDFLNADKR